MEFNGPAPKAVRASLKAISGEFGRCSTVYPPIYHEMWVPELRPNDLMLNETQLRDGKWIEGVCGSFRAASNGLLRDVGKIGEGWEAWSGASDGRYFGRFYGSPKGFSEFKALAETAYTVLEEISTDLSSDGANGWIKILHDMATGYPTPLLQCEAWAFWQCPPHEDEDWSEWFHTTMAVHGEDPEDWPEEERERLEQRWQWVMPESGKCPFPQCSLYSRLRWNLLVSSRAAIDLILDRDTALLVGDYTHDFPISFVNSAEPLPNTLEEPKAIATDSPEKENRFCEPVRRFDFDGIWRLESNTGDKVEKEGFPCPKDQDTGFRDYEFLLLRPMKWFSALEILIGTGQTPAYVDVRGVGSVHASCLSRKDGGIEAIEADGIRAMCDEEQRLERALFQKRMA